MPVARAAFFATRLSPAPVLRIVRFAAFTTFFVLDFLRLAILFPPIRYLVGPSPRLRDGPGLVRLLSPVLRVVETTGSHPHTHTALAATQRVCAVTCSHCYRYDYPDAGTTSRSRRVAAPLCGAGGAVTRSRSIANRLYSGSRLLGGGGPKRARVRKSTAESQEVHPDCLPATGLRPNLN
jgi:hypothetical protein